MLTLALDTSTQHLSAALVQREGDPSTGLRLTVLVERHESPPQKQSELLPGVLMALLAEAGYALGDVELLALGMGPGSFTGLRIGLATFKALAFTRGLKIARASSLAALAFEGPEGHLLYACALARQGELYVGAFRKGPGGVDALSPEDVDTTASLAVKLRTDPGARVLGPGLDSTESALLELGVLPEQILASPRFPSAVSVARLAELPAAFAMDALFALEPHYLRASEPERNPKFPPLPGPVPTARIVDKAKED